MFEIGEIALMLLGLSLELQIITTKKTFTFLLILTSVHMSRSYTFMSVLTQNLLNLLNRNVHLSLDFSENFNYHIQEYLICKFGVSELKLKSHVRLNRCEVCSVVVLLSKANLSHIQ